MAGGKVIIDPGGGGGGGSPGALAPFQSGGKIDLAGIVEFLTQNGIIATVYPFQNRIVLEPGFFDVDGVTRLDVEGDLLVRGAAGFGRLALGSVGQVLRSNGTDPAWAFEPARCYKAANEDFSGTGFADVASLSFPVVANGIYAFRFFLPFATTDSTEAGNFAVNGPASPTNLIYEARYSTSIGQSVPLVKTAYDSSLAQTSGPGATPKACTLEGLFENGANAGTFTARAATETGSGGRVTTVQRGAFGLLWRMA